VPSITAQAARALVALAVLEGAVLALVVEG
jgi:hypothetical protein